MGSTINVIVILGVFEGHLSENVESYVFEGMRNMLV